MNRRSFFKSTIIATLIPLCNKFLPEKESYIPVEYKAGKLCIIPNDFILKDSFQDLLNNARLIGERIAEQQSQFIIETLTRRIK